MCLNILNNSADMKLMQKTIKFELQNKYNSQKVYLIYKRSSNPIFQNHPQSINPNTCIGTLVLFKL